MKLKFKRPQMWYQPADEGDKLLGPINMAERLRIIYPNGTVEVLHLIDNPTDYPNHFATWKDACYAEFGDERISGYRSYLNMKKFDKDKSLQPAIFMGYL